MKRDSLKQEWLTPNLTEIEVRMTETNKVGFGTDQWSTEQNGLHGKLRPDGSCCCS